MRAGVVGPRDGGRSVSNRRVEDARQGRGVIGFGGPDGWRSSPPQALNSVPRLPFVTTDLARSPVRLLRPLAAGGHGRAVALPPHIWGARYAFTPQSHASARNPAAGRGTRKPTA